MKLLTARIILCNELWDFVSPTIIERLRTDIWGFRNPIKYVGFRKPNNRNILIMCINYCAYQYR